MGTIKWDLESYLQALKSGEIATPRPFDKKSDINVELGPIAKSLIIPDIDIDKFIPPQVHTIRGLYTQLKPVLEELTSTNEFDWAANYGTLSANDIAKGYLFNTINTTLVKEGAFSPKDLALQAFLRHVSDAMVDKISPNDAATAFATKPHVRSQFESMILSMSLLCPTKRDLLAKYVNESRYNLAYFASLFDEDEFEKQLCMQLKGTLHKINEITQEHKPGKLRFWRNSIHKVTNFPVDAKDNDSLITMLGHFSAALANLKQTNSLEASSEVLGVLKNSTFFGSNIYIGKTNKELKESIEKLQKEIGLVMEKQTVTRLSMSWIPSKLTKDLKDSIAPKL